MLILCPGWGEPDSPEEIKYIIMHLVRMGTETMEALMSNVSRSAVITVISWGVTLQRMEWRPTEGRY